MESGDEKRKSQHHPKWSNFIAPNGQTEPSIWIYLEHLESSFLKAYHSSTWNLGVMPTMIPKHHRTLDPAIPTL